MTSVTLSVPASAANLGPGFDSLGLALSLRNTLEVRAAPSGIRVLIEGEGKDSLPSDAGNLIVRAMLKVFRLADRPAPGLELRAHNRIPLAAGLGSSAAAIVSGLAAADALTGLGLPRARLLQLASEMEGHPDNAAAAIFGGLNLVVEGPDGPVAHPLPLGLSQVVLVTPDLPLATSDMRRGGARNIPFEGGGVDPKTHAAPLRRRAAARAAGAAGAALSGAGPSVLAFAFGREAEVGRAMAQAFERHGVASRWRSLPIDLQGLQIEAAPG